MRWAPATLLQEPTVDQLMTVHGRLILIDPKVRRSLWVQGVRCHVSIPCPLVGAGSNIAASPAWPPPALALCTLPQDESTGFAQLTVRIPSKQRFAAFNRAGQLVGGSLEKVGLACWAGCWLQ